MSTFWSDVIWQQAGMVRNRNRISKISLKPFPTKPGTKPRILLKRKCLNFSLKNLAFNFRLIFLISSNNKINSLIFLRKYFCLAIGGTFGLVFLDVKCGYIVHAECFDITNGEGRFNNTIIVRNQ